MQKPTSWLHPCWTAERVQAFHDLKMVQTGRDDIRAAWKQIPDHHKAWLEATILQGTMPMKVQAAWVVPVLSESACQYIIEKSEGKPWTENDIEQPEYRIPEQVLCETDPLLYRELELALFAGLAPYLITIFGRLPDAYNSIQLTRYSFANRKAGNYHIDSTSDYTAVICLNHDFNGGGTTLCDGLVGEISIPPIPVGHALIFEGKAILHKGNTVTEGERRLLTVWMSKNQENVW